MWAGHAASGDSRLARIGDCVAYRKSVLLRDVLDKVRPRDRLCVLVGHLQQRERIVISEQFVLRRQLLPFFGTSKHL